MSEQADLMRRAAKLMRERAGAATPGPWRHMCLGSEGCLVLRDSGTIRERGRGRVARFGQKDWQPDHADAEYVSGMHPEFALAVADWLDAAADDFGGPKCDAQQGICAPCEHRPDYLAAIRVAQEYLESA